MKLFCIYDRISGKYGPIVEMDNVQVMYRAIRNIQDPLVKANPGDFDIIELGDYDNVTGVIVPRCDFVAHVIDVYGGDELNGTKEN